MLYGREQDVAAVRALLAQHRLVSIVGAGGIGKTRLAQTVAHGYRDTFPDGVWVVEFAGITDAELVPAHLAGALGSHTARTRRHPRQSSRALAPQIALLVFDNCEHLLESVSTIVEAITQAAASVRVLVTSQEPLKTTEEHVYRLGTLAVPAAETSAADVSAYGAVALFVARASALDPRFRLTADNAAAVTESVAAWTAFRSRSNWLRPGVSLLNIEGLRARLDERFRLLTGGARFRACEGTRRCAPRSTSAMGCCPRPSAPCSDGSGVFVGSFAIDAAQDGLFRRCTRSLASARRPRRTRRQIDDRCRRRTGTPRLRVLETARAYALEKLADGGETTQALERHACAVAAQIANTYHDYVHIAEAEWLARYEPEIDNLRAALTWAFAHDSALAIALIGDTLKLWQELGLIPEGLGHCEQALACLGPPPQAVPAGRLWYAVAMLVANTWVARSAEAARRAIPLLAGSGDTLVLAFALARLAGSLHGAPGRSTAKRWSSSSDSKTIVAPGPARVVRYAAARGAPLRRRSPRHVATSRRRAHYICKAAPPFGPSAASSTSAARRPRDGRTRLRLEASRRVGGRVCAALAIRTGT